MMTDPISMAFLFEKINQHFDQRMPFVVYNKPNAAAIIAVFQKNNTLYCIEDFNEKGFVLAPFDGDEIVLIPENQSEIVMANCEATSSNEPFFEFNEREDDKAKSKYLNLIQKGITAIEKGIFGKVVLSRKESIALSNFELTVVFKKVVQSYPTAFSYCFFHPKVGLWLGAFSEQLLQVKSKDFKTMAVAGTQKFQKNSKVIWETKEKEEQQFVTDFILDNIKEYVSNSTISEPYTLKAGNLLHIKTDIQGILKAPTHLKEVLDILHPTPAVCGFPKAIAKDFILKNEGYDREYYSGFLGEFNFDFKNKENNTELYVNLRCMKIDFENAKANLFVGGGITKDSIPEDEWIETVNKSKTMIKVLV